MRRIFLLCVAVLLSACGGGSTTPPLSSNADLADLVFSVAGFDQPFDPDQADYTATVDFAVTTITATATTADPDATLAIDGNSVTSGTATPAIDLGVGENVITVVVTAENGTTNRTYTMTVSRRPNPQPTDFTGLRSSDGGSNVLLLVFSAVNPVNEDRTIAHYDITGLSGVQPTTTLYIPVLNQDSGFAGGIIEVYSFAGDGVVSTDEWAVGTLFHTFSNIDGARLTLSVDITSLLQSAVDSGDNYLSFNFRAGAGTDRFFLGSSFSLDDPTISSPPPPQSCAGTGPVGNLVIQFATEVEPNDDIATAFGVIIPTPGPNVDSVGLLVNGNVHDALDRVDTISFTSSRTIKFFFKLCESSCNFASGNDKNGNPDSLDTSIAYFDVLDAAGRTMASTRTNVSTENYAELCVEGGVITYIMVIANDTMNTVQEYVIAATESF